MLDVAGLIWSRRANEAEFSRVVKAVLMNINEVTKRSTSRIRRRHHHASKAGSVQSRTEKLHILRALGMFYGVFKTSKNSSDCIQTPFF